jgi:hypothetical protein
LTAVLESEEAEKSQAAGFSARHIDSYDTTLLSGVVEGKSELRRVQPITHSVILFSFYVDVNGKYFRPFL